MRRVRLILALNAAIAALCVPAFSQTTSTEPPSVSETTKEFDRLLANSDQLHRSTARSATAPRSAAPVLAAIPEFRKATADLREAVSAQQNVRAPLQSLGKLIKPLAEYFKNLNLKSAAPDMEEFKGYTRKDLMWETLTTAERVDNNLQIYGEIDSDLKRFKWLAEKTAHR